MVASYTKIGAVLAALFMVSAQAVCAREALPFAAILGGKSLTSPFTGSVLVPSPDTRDVAYTVESQLPEVPGGLLKTDSIWHADYTKTKKVTKICCNRGSAIDPQWSPDGSRLAYIYLPEEGQATSRDAVLKVWDKRTASSEIVQPHVHNEYFTPRFTWLPNGSQIVVAIDTTSDRTAESIPLATPENNVDARPTPQVYISSPQGNIQALGDRDHYLREHALQLVIIDIHSGKQVILAHGPINDFAVSPDGRYCVYAQMASFHLKGYGNPIDTIFLYDMQTGVTRTIQSNVNTIISPRLSWSADGTHLIFSMLAKSDCSASICLPWHRRYATYTIATQAVRFFPAFATSLRPDAPLWLSDTAAAVVDGRSIHIFANMGERTIILPAPSSGCTVVKNTLTCPVQLASGHVAIISIDSASGRSWKARNIGRLRVLNKALRDTSQGCIFAGESYDVPQAIYWASSDFTSIRPIITIDPSLKNYAYGTSHIVQWQTQRYGTLTGVLALPTGYDNHHKYPVIVDVYPDDAARTSIANDSSNCFGDECDGLEGIFNTQLYQSRGYAVFIPSIPVQPSTRMQDVIQDVDAGIHVLVTSGIADPKRIGIFGQSQGGYAALSLAVGLPHLAAVAALSSYSNYIYFDVDNYRAIITENQDMATTLWRDPARFVRNSPIFFMNKVRAPVLLLQGTQDDTTPLADAEGTFGALQFLNKPAELVVYPTEGHAQTYYSTQNQLDVFNRIIGWFNTYMAP